MSALDIVVQNGEIVLVKMTALVASKKLIKQIPFAHSIFKSDAVEIVGWIDGSTLDRDLYHPVALATINGNLRLIKASRNYFGADFIEEIMAKPQIFLQ